MNGNDTKKTGDENRENPTGATRKDIESLLGIISSLGLTSILIVVIGRIWTTAYFDHFGLPSSGLEFSVYDYAFRSLEVLISLFLGAIGFILAWLNREWLKHRGPRFEAFELLIIFILLVWLSAVLAGWVPDSFLSMTGVLGVSSGLALAATIWFVVDVWEGPGPGALPGWIHGLLGCPGFGWLRWLADVVGERQQFPPEQTTQNEEARERNRRRIMLLLAGRGFTLLLLVVIGVGYVAWLSPEFARLDARLDVKQGKLPSAILESDGPLPAEIASDADPCTSVGVRVILSQSDNTYVLHSTHCTTVGERKIETRVERGEEFAPPGSPDICQVFAIPTERLKSVKYFQVSGKAPANESRLQAVEVGLDRPFRDDICTRGASDEEDAEESHRLCKGEKREEEDEDARFFNSVWYTFTPAADGAVLATAKASGFDPVVGIWEEPASGAALRDASGSGEETGLACEATVGERQLEEKAPGATPTVPPGGTPEDRGEDDQAEMARVTAVIANVHAGTRYVAAVGAQENAGGDVVVTLEFMAGAHFFNPASAPEDLPIPECDAAESSQEQVLVPRVTESPRERAAVLEAAESPQEQALVPEEEPLLPQVEIVSDQPTIVTVELWELERETYELRAHTNIAPKLWLLRGDGEVKCLTTPDGGEEPGRTILQATLCSEEEQGQQDEDLCQGTWTLNAEGDFEGLAELAVTVPPDLVLAFADTTAGPLYDLRVQAALLLALDEAAIRGTLGYEGRLTFDPESHHEKARAEGMRALEEAGDVKKAVDLLLEEAGVADSLRVQIAVEEERGKLTEAAQLVQEQLGAVDVSTVIGQCAEACIRVFFCSSGAN